jgi:histidinol-phosphatase (PHP family)
MTLPPDSHVHTEWSWDAVLGSMEASCVKALEVGLPSLAFTEHADLSPWMIPVDIAPHLPDHFRVRLRPDGAFEAPELNVEGYLEGIERCRDRFPGLRILSGVELSEPHWHQEQAESLLRGGGFERVLGSVHAVRGEGGNLLTDLLQATWPIERVMHEYLAEALRLVESSSAFEVLAHIDYAARSWPESAGPYDPGAFEDEFRTVLRALARSGRVLEVNTKVPLHHEILRWWYEDGGDAVSFGSDAHDPADVARGFPEAAAMAEFHGFHPGRDPHDFWRRHPKLGT